jgi:Tol biopolymer transport system component
MSALRFCILPFVCCVMLAAVSSPDDRPITDPHSITSEARPGVVPIPIETLFFTRNVADPAWSPDGTEIVFSTNLTGRMNLWKVPASGGWPIQLTASDDRQENAVWSPNGKWIIFQQDFAGGEIFDIFALPRDGSDLINVTRTGNISESNPRWSPDGKLVAFSYRPKASSTVDIALLDWTTRHVRKLTNEQDKSRLWGTAVWSPDGKSIFAERSNAGDTDSDVYRINVASGALDNLTPHSGQIRNSVPSISPDGRTLLITSNQKYGYDNVALLDVTSKQLTWVTDLKWQARAGDFSPDGNTFTYALNEDGRSDVFLVDRKTGHADKTLSPSA